MEGDYEKKLQKMVYLLVAVLIWGNTSVYASELDTDNYKKTSNASEEETEYFEKTISELELSEKMNDG